MIELIWSRCVPHLQRVVDRAPTDASLKSIKDGLLNGVTMLLIVTEGEEVIAATTLEKVTYSTGHKVLFFPAVGGDRMEEWSERFLEIINAIAVDLGCEEIRGAACRKGWLRSLQSADKQKDWYELHTVIGCKVKQIEEK